MRPRSCGCHHPPGGQGIVTQPDSMHESASQQNLQFTITEKPRVLEPRDKTETHPRMISIASTLIHPDQVSPASVSLLTSLMSSVRKTSTYDSSSAKNDVSKRETTRVVHKTETTGHSESVLRSNGRRWCRDKRSTARLLHVRTFPKQA